MGADATLAAVEAFVDTSRNSRLLLFVAGLAAVVTGGTVLSRLAWWYGSDMGWDGSGSSLRSVAGPLRLIGAAVAVVVLGIVAMVVARNQASGPRRALAAIVAVAAAVIPLALLAYPRIEPAVLTSAAGWHVRLPLTQLLGVRSQSGDQLVVEGKLDRRRCGFELRAVTLDVATGDVTAVRTLPSTYADISVVPPPPGPLDAERFSVDHGSSPFICSS